MEASLRENRRQFERPEFNVQQTEFPSLDGRMGEPVAPAVGISRRPRWGHRSAYRAGDLDDGEFPSLRDEPSRSDLDSRQRNNPNNNMNSNNFRNAPVPLVQVRKIYWIGVDYNCTNFFFFLASVQQRRPL